MPAESLVDRAIGEIVDGRGVNWSVIEGGVRTGAESEYLEYMKCLRVLDAIAEVHRSTHVESSSEVATVSPDARNTMAGEEPVDVWGRYRLLQKVGEGSFGSVYRAWDPQLEREIAIKILHRRVADHRLTDRLLREGRALAKIRHPNVVNVLGVEAHEDRVGLCMEFVRGRTLEAELQARRTLSAREAVLAGEDVCRALASVHRAGFVHRDVKARNVMREEGGRIVLMDFGTGREAAEPGAGPLDVAGTPVYMAPEALAGGPATPASDVYSVGVLLYHLVTGTYPVSGQTMDDLRRAHRLGERARLSEQRPDLPLPFIKVVDSALAIDPQARCRSAGALLEALATVDGATRTFASRTLHYLVLAGIAAIAGVLAFVGIGFITSIAFNAALGRSGYADETIGSWFRFGWMSSVKPAFIGISAFLAARLLAIARRVLAATSARFRRLEDGFTKRVAAVAHRLRLQDSSTLASWVLVLSVIVLSVACWRFAPLIGAVGATRISTATRASVAMLSPALQSYHDQYREVFSYVTIGLVVVWYYTARRVRRTNGSLKNATLAAGAAVVLLALALLDLPYRLLLQARFEAVRWHGNSCYVIGERPADLLLFCPALPPPRNRIVPNDVETLERSGAENIFTRFGAEYSDSR